jgi:pimeloyl-ACP methyl ester carboxylesterase
VRYAERQREFFPQAQVKIFDDSGHWPFADNSERVAEIVIPFIRQALSASQA